MVLSSYRVTGRRSEDGPPASIIDAGGKDDRSLYFYRADGSDDVFLSILGPRGGVQATICVPPEVISALVQELVGRGMNLTVDARKRLAAERSSFYPCCWHCDHEFDPPPHMQPCSTGEAGPCMRGPQASSHDSEARHEPAKD